MRQVTFFILLGAAMLVSCNEELLQEQENVKPTAPALEKSNGNGNAPAQSGHFVTRNEETLALIFVDYDAGLTVLFAVDVYDFCDPFPNFGSFQLVPVQEVDIPNDPLRQHLLVHGEVFFQVFDGAIGFSEFICFFIDNTPLLAEGMATATFTGNDILSSSASNNMNTYGFTAHGTLYDPADNPVSFRALYRALWDDGDNSLLHEVMRVTLN